MVSVHRTDAVGARAPENAPERLRLAQVFRGGFVQRMGGSMGPGGFAPKARGLAELVGLPDFFIELHSRFVQLLLELGVVLSS